MTGPLFQVQHHGTDRLRLVGSLDLSGAAQARAAVTDRFTGGSDRIIIDLWDLRFCDCAGLNVLLEAKVTADMLAIELCVEGARAQVARLFALTGADEVLLTHSVTRLPPRTS
ncbi:STAS domain-containing protein [Streptomyces sp. NPDC051561]|uniref:STAS domain-containing protein n=1 Tax=Streptomyces sp. NPDC051561 TaxID=3365658 RepID=UPI00379A9BE1